MTKYPFEDICKMAFGVMKLSPATFWAMTPAEYALALDGHMLSVGAKKQDMTWNDVLDMMDSMGVIA